MAFHVIRKYSNNRYSLNGHEVFIKTKPLTTRWKRGFEAARAASLASDGKSVGEKMGAALFQGARLLSTGHNLYAKTKPGNSHRMDNGVVFNTSVHAEQMAIDKIKHYDYSNAKLTVYVVRLDMSGNFVLSKPCDICVSYMKEHGIKVARFINEKGMPEEMVL